MSEYEVGVLAGDLQSATDAAGLILTTACTSLVGLLMPAAVPPHATAQIVSIDQAGDHIWRIIANVTGDTAKVDAGMRVGPVTLDEHRAAMVLWWGD